MKVLLIFLMIGVFINSNAKSNFGKLPPSEMIMMGGFDDDVESTDEEEFIYSSPKIEKIDKDKKSIDLFITGSKDKEKNTFESYDDEGGEKQSTDLSKYNQPSSGNFKVALLVPKKVIGSYANSVSNSIISYLLFKNTNFNFEVFDSVDENEESIYGKIIEIKSKGYNFVIAPVTVKGAEALTRLSDDLLVFIPTINRYEMGEVPPNIIFGGIDYRSQIDSLLDYANDKVAVFNDGSRVSSELSQYIKEKAFKNIVYTREIKNIKTNLSYILKKNHKLQKSSIFLNMPIVKSSLLASQLTQYNLKPHVVLSTQVNYNPLLFKLTQKKDREFFYIANSIFYPNNNLKDINILLGNNPDFSWIDYSASIGLDYIFSNQLKSMKVFDESIEENQIYYKTRVEKAGASSFEPISRSRFDGY